jgi:indolepyruvate ferredoxin oxidoreductase
MTEHPEAILLGGVAALVRAPVEQIRAGRSGGLWTAAFVSGCQGSPLDGYDRELARNRDLFDGAGVVHRPRAE